jgi:tetratricopeptide (TPR) repeat protein
VTPPAAAPEGTAPQAAAATALNDRGFALLNEGRYSDAIPVLRQAVSASNGSGGLTHAYALYNLGHALRLAGRATEAIPVLERRLQIDNQRATVARELKAARRGNHDTGGARPGD